MADIEFHKALARELRRPHRSQTDLARHLGVDPSAVNRMATGARKVKLDEYPLIVQYLLDTGGRPEDIPALAPDSLPRADATLLEVFPDIAGVVKDRPTDLVAVLRDLANRKHDCASVCVAAREVEAIIRPINSEVRHRTLGGMADIASKVASTPPVVMAAFRIVALRDAFVQSAAPLSFEDANVRAAVLETIDLIEIDSLKAKAAVDIRTAWAAAVVLVCQLLALEPSDQ